MIYLVSIEHESWLEDPEARADYLAYCMDVKPKVEKITGRPGEPAVTTLSGPGYLKEWGSMPRG